MKSNYHERKQNRIDRYNELSEGASIKSDNLYKESSRMAKSIPFGQPILVGHHSEKSDRNFRNRIHYKMGQSVNEAKKSNYYANKAAAAESNTAISSDNPDAIKLLKEKIENLVKFQEAMKAANKVIRNKKLTKDDKINKLIEIGLKKKNAQEALTPDFCGRVGFPPYCLQNNNTNINRCKKRLATLEKAELEETTEIVINGVRVRDNVEENRLQIFFPDKPNELIRGKLKAHGFKWAKSVGAWQRFRSWQALYFAETILSGLNKTM